jgi:putative ABC transport system permease protein
MDKEISIHFLGTWYIPLFLVVFALFIGILAGIYPAFMLSSFRPVAVLKGKAQTGTRQRMLRNGLVVFQSFTTICLLVGTMVIHNQLHFMRKKDLGFNKDNIIIIKNAYVLGERQQAFKSELKKNPQIMGASYSASSPFMTLVAQIYGKEGRKIKTNYTLINMETDYDFEKTYSFSMKEGRFLSRENPTDDSALILNEAAVLALGLDEPVIGQQLSRINEKGERYTIIGIAENFHIESLHETIRPLSISLEKSSPVRLLSIRIGSEQVEKTLSFIKKQWQALDAAQPLDLVFLDDRFEKEYTAEIQTGNVFSAFTILAIFIACLGLFGLASFMAEQKTKEIGVRKILGATVPGIVINLSKEYLKWPAIANILAWPLAYYAMNQWLHNFAFRTSLSIWPFITAGGATLTISLLTVSYQSIKVALSHPVKSLRCE